MKGLKGPSGTDKDFFVLAEIKQLLEIVRPKIAFCQKEKHQDYKKAVEELGLDTRVVSFDGDNENFDEIMDVYQDNEPIEEFA